jgi:4-hydroxybenzoate polyprenyltransferase
VAVLVSGDPASGWPVAARLGLSMTLLQASIGALNDVIDSPRDAIGKPGKPIPSGWVSVPVAWAVVVATAVGGLLLAAPSGQLTIVVAFAVLACGYGYDLWAKGTAWSWLPFAVGIPLLPVFATVGATGGMPRWLPLLVLPAFPAGAALAIANSLVDIDRDGSAGVVSAATRLGPGQGWRVHAALLGIAVVGAGVGLRLVTASLVALAGFAAAAVVALVGAWLLRSTSSAVRERGWEAEAVGVGLGAVAWVAGLIGLF